ncbi:hypothetical protein Esi_0049_0026 [Ectocarpus siliculosus]|uniref:Uncharacterized protein n=1 Tax=Ectocarpus siliculosus TaxID=2880 RepID=D7G2W4_ECTSI|nr:hypothetical protein Esi_0049_0026 [Ectocarpus siliculosus]|eukprot:CBJ48821.1 hypothetical protein Esi_0049_0026 [Ectocarpus siliculosus]
MDGSNNNNGGGGERWAAWDGGNRWMPGEEGAGANADDGHRHRHAGHATPPLLPGLAQAPSPAAAAGLTASRRSAAVWEGAPHGGGWVGGPADIRQQGSSWHPSGGASGAAEGRGQGYERMAHSGIGEGAGVARDAFAGDRRHQHQQPEVDVRGGGGGGGLRFHPSAVEHQQHHAGPSARTAAPRVIGGSAVSAPGFRHGAVSVDPAPAAVGGTSADPSSVAAGGGLLSQGYRRLAAMADEQAAAAAGGDQLDLSGGRRGGGAHPSPPPPPPPPAAVLHRPPLHHSPIGRPPLPHEYDAVAERETGHHKRSASSLVGAGSGGRDPAGYSPLGERAGPRHRQVSRELPFSSLAGGDGPATKRRRPSVDGGDRPLGGVIQQQQQQQQVRGRSTSNERLTHGNGSAASWPSGASGSGTPLPPAAALVYDDVLAREFEESERELLSSRVAVDLAQARFEEASRTHHAKREQVLAAAAEHQKQLSIAASHHHQGQEQQQQTPTLKGGASVHSPARSSEVAAETSAPTGRAAAAGGRHGAANDGRGSGSEERHNSDSTAAFHHRRDSAPLGRRSPAARGRSERPSEAYSRSPSLEALGPDSASPAGKVSSSPSPSAAGQAQPDCADEMMEVKLEAALLCGMGRAPVSSRQLASAAAGAAVTPSPKAVSAGAEKGLEIVSLAAAAAAAVSSSSGDGDGNVVVPPRSSSSSSSRGGIRRDLSERTHSPLPSLPWKGGHNHHHHQQHQQQHQHHRSAMGQAPGSPSACGETDSDHSSDRGCAAIEDLAGSKKQQHHELQRPVVPRAVGRGGAGRLSWTDYGDAGGDRRAPPLAKLTADVLV